MQTPNQLVLDEVLLMPSWCKRLTNRMLFPDFKWRPTCTQSEYNVLCVHWTLTAVYTGDPILPLLMHVDMVVQRSYGSVVLITLLLICLMVESVSSVLSSKVLNPLFKYPCICFVIVCKDASISLRIDWTSLSRSQPSKCTAKGR